jgi:hypothetical protein
MLLWPSISRASPMRHPELVDMYFQENTKDVYSGLNGRQKVLRRKNPASGSKKTGRN